MSFGEMSVLPRCNVPVISDKKAMPVQDRSFTFVLKTPPASVLLQKAAGVAKGSGTPNDKKVGKVTQAQLRVGLHTTCKHIIYIMVRCSVCGHAWQTPAPLTLQTMCTCAA